MVNNQCLGFSNLNFMVLVAYFDLWNHTCPSQALKGNSFEMVMIMILITGKFLQD